MLFQVQKNTESKNPKVVRTKNGRIVLLSNVEFVIVKNRNWSKSKKIAVY